MAIILIIPLFITCSFPRHATEQDSRALVYRWSSRSAQMTITCTGKPSPVSMRALAIGKRYSHDRGSDASLASFTVWYRAPSAAPLSWGSLGSASKVNRPHGVFGRTKLKGVADSQS